MMHWKAKRFLPSLMDDTLEERAALDLRVHVASCARCRRAQREYELSESLLRRLPSTLLPVEASPTSYGRLVSLSRWYDDPALPTPDRWRAPALTAASLAMVFSMAVTVGAWSPIVGEGSGRVMLGAVNANSAAIPVSWTWSQH